MTDTDQPDTERTRRLLDGLMPVPAVPHDFAQRVLAARDREGKRLQRRWWPWATAAVVTAAAAAVVIFAARRADSLGGASVQASERQTVQVGSGAVAVIEPHGEIAWQRHGGAVRVEQRRGDVFYRVDRGSNFVVASPAGEVVVTGTCFRVTLQGPGSDAAYVQVLEGSVDVRNSAGKAGLVAGDWGRLVADRAPERMTRAPSTLPVALEQLFARAQDRPGAVKLKGALPSPLDTPEATVRRRWVPLTAEERLDLARRCKFGWGLPRHLNRAEAVAAPDGVPLSAEERAAVVRVLEEHRAAYFEQVRGIYTEVTGEHADATVSAMALHHEIDTKSSRPDGKAARQRILQEWAGDVEPPAAGATLQPIERFWRLQVSTVEESIRRLTPIIGAERAQAVIRALIDMAVMGDEDNCASGKH
jgi:hypothetical protein